MAVSNTMYAFDHEGKMVPIENSEVGHWYRNQDFREYLGVPEEDKMASYNDPDGWPEELQCPTVRAKSFGSRRLLHRLYSINRTNVPSLPGAGGTTGYQPAHMDQVRRPTQKVLFTEGNSHTTDQFKANFELFWDRSRESIPPWGAVTYRHGGQVNIAYFDGHAGALDKKQAHHVGTVTEADSDTLWDIYPDANDQ